MYESANCKNSQNEFYSLTSYIDIKNRWKGSLEPIEFFQISAKANPCNESESKKRHENKTEDQNDAFVWLYLLKTMCFIENFTFFKIRKNKKIFLLKISDWRILMEMKRQRIDFILRQT